MSARGTSAASSVLCLAQVGHGEVTRLLAPYRLQLRLLPPQARIPGSYWGDSEAGLVRDELFVRQDTPLHSLLHETSHYVCMTPDRRARLDRDAGGDDPEETAVCYLQVLFADALHGFGRERAFRDMDAWGYSFRNGSARAWFEQDADDAHGWLLRHHIIDEFGRPTGRSRE